MACKFICDGCGKEEPAEQNHMGNWFHPRDWYERSDKDGIQTACSRGCIELIAKKSGKSPVVLPI